MRYTFLILFLAVIFLVSCSPIDDVQDIKVDQEDEEENEIEATVKATEQIVLESAQDAYNRQIAIVSETVEIVIEDYDLENGCTIKSEDSLFSDENLDITYKFDSEFEGQEIIFSCDQYERYGESSDQGYHMTVPSSLKVDQTCDWGRVTAPTVYWVSASDGTEAKDYCRKGVTILPLEKDIGECFDEETLDDMRSDCQSDGWEAHTILDAKSCDTIYCGVDYDNNCPSESRLSEAQDQCSSDGLEVVEYTDNEGCNQIRCSSCPYEEDIESETAECESIGASAVIEFDETTGCQWVYCEYEDTELENPSESIEGTQEEELIA